MEEPGALPSVGSHRVGHDWSNLAAAAASRGYSSLWCSGFSLWWLLLVLSTGCMCTGFSVAAQRLNSWQLPGSRAQGSVAVLQGLSCSSACGIFPDQGVNPYPLHWQGDSYSLHTREVPSWNFKGNLLILSSRLGLLYCTSLQTVNTSIPGKYSDSLKYLSYDLAWILFMYLDCLLFLCHFF